MEIITKKNWPRVNFENLTSWPGLRSPIWPSSPRVGKFFLKWKWHLFNCSQIWDKKDGFRPGIAQVSSRLRPSKVKRSILAKNGGLGPFDHLWSFLYYRDGPESMHGNSPSVKVGHHYQRSPKVTLLKVMLGHALWCAMSRQSTHASLDK